MKRKLTCLYKIYIYIYIFYFIFIFFFKVGDHSIARIVSQISQLRWPYLKTDK